MPSFRHGDGFIGSVALLLICVLPLILPLRFSEKEKGKEGREPDAAPAPYLALDGMNALNERIELISTYFQLNDLLCMTTPLYYCKLVHTHVRV